MTTTDRICAFLQSKLPHSFWTFHGDSIRAFVEKEVCKSLLDLSVPPSEAEIKLIDDLKAIASGRFEEQSKVSPAAMQEVIGGGDAGVSLNSPVSPLSETVGFSETPPASDAHAEHDWHDGREPPDDRRYVIGEWIEGMRKCCYGFINDQWYYANRKGIRVVSPPIRWRELTDAERESMYG